MAQHNAPAAHGAHDSHDSHAGHDTHASFKSYAIGFILAVILTVIPFKLVMDGSMDKGTILWIILGMAVVQMLVHLKYFLHLDTSSEQRSNVIALLFTALILVIVVAGSLWIMHNLNANMMVM
ncbi:cytochrome o ubiquinol oxidase protein CyoD [Cupriavidus necator N-1]|jgi:cytochrome o ubiquinol oxidase subunit IV|uniref:Cytochrome bo(3) ubiquinol oxidase subunit 4 n=1 Tax=Cupriavidus necator (strain ATCC 43291 / DSM 13513 / CCUG 52238 / LMG 8453 / N-1) TaxID=1042878 RepID=G0F088_CUPNN|nr:MULTISPECIES: cytochrome o ubiquinol oxidase subunit IV [Cupriavidus]AEI76373.1 cytochrome o ubiquinol oxidase protein CyoD [Cupriavidus necator N-1]EYS93000.1 cytochrome C oxidase [Cupriavidus sp. SK-4]KAI3596252.1 Cytochrome O ubiquinol oxidase subunit IV [Cupriavidus necator H850]MDX6011504.1 cytochrome o ubiquinol oxidase subunit IV [Cupriavidus necator]QUN29377.1 cytochrome o ubiquinol oxidase subunit IV [Cupriavidus sp. KK10]